MAYPPSAAFCSSQVLYVCRGRIPREVTPNTVTLNLATTAFGLHYLNDLCCAHPICQSSTLTKMFTENYHIITSRSFNLSPYTLLEGPYKTPSSITYSFSSVFLQETITYHCTKHHLVRARLCQEYHNRWLSTATFQF